MSLCVASPPEWGWRWMTDADVEWLVDLKARAMRQDLERLRMWNPARSRERLLGELVIEATRVVAIEGAAVGSIALVPAPEASWLQHFYVDPAVQGQGVGEAVLRRLLEADAYERSVQLLTVRESRAIGLYERHGFRHERDHENGVDVVLVRERGASRNEQ